MTDWSTIADLGTACGTLVLGVATFAAVKSANRSSRISEQALAISVRPVLVQSRDEDPPQPVMWVDQRWGTCLGGHGYVECSDDVVYLAMLVRNVGSGIAVIQAWRAVPGRLTSTDDFEDPSTFRRHTRDLFIAPHDSGFWIGALREPADPTYALFVEAIAQQHPVTVEILYTDHDGHQPTISRFTLVPRDGSPNWLCTVVRHHSLDRDDVH